MTKKIDVAIVGAGEVANTIHLPSWKNIPEADVKVLCDINMELASNTAEKWGIGKFTTEFDEILDSDDKMMIDICTPQ